MPSCFWSSCLSLLFFALIPSALATEPSWVMVSDDDGIQTFKMERPDDPLVALKGIGIVEAPLLKVAAVLMDDDRSTEWIDHLEESNLLKFYSPKEFLVYTHVGTPFVLKDRDFVTRGRSELDPAASHFRMTLTSVEDNELMPPGKYVRGELQGSWDLVELIPGANGEPRTQVTAEMRADPKGNVPKWIVNLFQKGWARDTLERLRKQVAKPDLVTPAVARAFFNACYVSPEAQSRIK